MVAWGTEALTTADTAADVAIDTTAGDIAPLGASAAAGSVGKAADAGHVHPTTGLVAIDTTAGDIAALGASAAAGSVGKAADAGHVHPKTGLVVIDATAGDIAALGTAAAAGSVGKAADAGHVHPNTGVLANVASTGTAGYTLVNGTGNILTWTAPNDGQMHRVAVFGQVKVTTNQTGGAIGLTFTYPDASSSATGSVNGGGSNVGYHGLANVVFLVAPNTTVTLQQTSALTAGAAVGWFELWAA